MCLMYKFMAEEKQHICGFYEQENYLQVSFFNGSGEIAGKVLGGQINDP